MALRRFYSLLFTIGAFFLLNPIVGLVDLLPDAVGALLIAASMTEIAMLDERTENAHRLIYYVAGISAARTVLMFFMFDMDESWVLSVTSLLGVAELFALIYFGISFFGGISYIAQRSDSDNVLGSVDRIKRLWIIFFIVRTASTVLPEVFALPQLTVRNNPDDIPWLTERQIVMYKYYARLLLGTISFFLGIWWFKNTASFMKGVRQDERFKASLEKRFCEFSAANPLHALFLDVRFALIMLVAGSAAMINITVDGTAVFPAWIGTVLLVLALFRLNPSDRTSLIIVGASAAVQVVAIHFLSGVLSEALLGVASTLALYLTERALTLRINAAIDWVTDAYFYITRIFYGAFFILGTVHAVWANYWVHLTRILCYGAWMATVLWVFASVTGEIKLRRRL